MSNGDDLTAGALALARRCAETMYAEDAASQHLGIAIEEVSVGAATMSMTVTDSMVNGHGIAHGGYIFTLADTAFAFACNTYDEVTVAQGAEIDFIRPALRGDRLRATAREVHRGRRNGLYEVRVCREDGTLLAWFRGKSCGLARSILQSSNEEKKTHA